jgi:transcriptional regulator with XRE-family HTH domain
VLRKSIHSSRQRELTALLRSLRAEAGLNQTELAGRLGKPQSFVSKYEAGERRLDDVELEQVCAALGLSLGEFVKRYEGRS